jgi:antitoxin HicB
MSDKSYYPIVVVQLSAENGGGFLAYAPDLQGCMSDGETPEEALRNAQQAVTEWVEEALESKREVHLPGTAAKASEQAKQNLIKMIRDQSKTIEQFDSELKEMRAALIDMSERLEKREVPAMWGSAAAYVTSRQASEDSVH